MSKPVLEQLEDRACPSVVTYHGGSVLLSPAIANLFVGDYDYNLDHTTTVVTGDYTRDFLGIYGISPGVHDGTVQLPSQGAISDHQVRQLLAQEIDLGELPAPDGTNQGYLVHLDYHVTDVQNAGAYHGYFAHNGVYVPYGVDFKGDDGTGWTHEYVEMATDPFLAGWYGDDPQTQEIADLGRGNAFKYEGVTVVVPITPNGQYFTTPMPYVPITNYTPQQQPYQSPTVTYLVYYFFQEYATFVTAVARQDYATASTAQLALTFDALELQAVLGNIF